MHFQYHTDAIIHMMATQLKLLLSTLSDPLGHLRGVWAFKVHTPLESAILARRDHVAFATDVLALMSLYFPFTYMVLSGTNILFASGATLLLVPFAYINRIFISCTLSCVAEVVTPHIPGLCYTTLMPYGCRYRHASRLGLAPKWEDIRVIRCLDQTGKYKVTKVGCHRAHIYPSKQGKILRELRPELEGKRIGIRADTLPHLVWCMRAFATVRVVTVLLMFWLLPPHVRIVTMVIYPIYVWKTLDMGPDLSFVIFGTGLLSGQVIWTISSMLTWFCVKRLAVYFGVGAIRNKWTRKGVPTAPQDSYPVGGPKTYTDMPYDNPNRNNEWGIKAPTDDGHLDPEFRDKYSQITGEREGVVKFPGSLHRIARHLREHFRNVAQRDPRHGGLNNTFVIGSTFLGYPSTMCGVCVSPVDGDSDMSHIVSGDTDPAQSRLCLPGRIATNTLPVGSLNESFNPQHTLSGLGGATIWLIHNYDDPIKSVLGLADANNTETVFVTLHATPGLFRYRQGRFPWSDQTWMHHEDGYTTLSWPTTSGAVYRHNTEVYMEHLKTDWVQTSPGVYYVSCVHLNLFDVTTIKWTRAEYRPKDTIMRSMAIQNPTAHCEVPRVVRDELTGNVSVERTATTVQHREYVVLSKDRDALEQNLRALVDNYGRNRNKIMDHYDKSIIDELFEARTLEKELRAFLDVHTPGSFLETITGQTSGDPVLRRIAAEALKLLNDQPDKYVEVKMIRQEESYVSVAVQRERPPIAVRTFELPTYQSESGVVLSQSMLDVRPVNDVLKLKTLGASLAEKVLHAVYGCPRPPGPVLPCGNAVSGGSDLTINGSRLTLHEYEFLVRDLGIVFIVRREDTDQLGNPVENVYYFGCSIQDTENPIRQPVIYIDTVANDCYRIHYGHNLSVSEIANKYGAKWADLADNNGWIPRDGTEREYGAPAGMVQQFQTYQKSEAIRECLKGNRRGITPEIMAAAAEMAEAQVWRIFDLAGIANPGRKDIPYIEQPQYGKTYDQVNDLEGSHYPAPHHFVGRDLRTMRNLRK